MGQLRHVRDKLGMKGKVHQGTIFQEALTNDTKAFKSMFSRAIKEEIQRMGATNGPVRKLNLTIRHEEEKYVGPLYDYITEVVFPGFKDMILTFYPQSGEMVTKGYMHKQLVEVFFNAVFEMQVTSKKPSEKLKVLASELDNQFFPWETQDMWRSIPLQHRLHYLLFTLFILRLTKTDFNFECVMEARKNIEEVEKAMKNATTQNGFCKRSG
tara:strand:- start:95 stop:730 length:636 start_codon:yes stop_codon:yes gene_type:complete